MTDARDAIPFSIHESRRAVPRAHHKFMLVVLAQSRSIPIHFRPTVDDVRPAVRRLTAIRGISKSARDPRHARKQAPNGRESCRENYTADTVSLKRLSRKRDESWKRSSPMSRSKRRLIYRLFVTASVIATRSLSRRVASHLPGLRENLMAPVMRETDQECPTREIKPLLGETLPLMGISTDRPRVRHARTQARMRACNRVRTSEESFSLYTGSQP